MIEEEKKRKRERKRKRKRKNCRCSTHGSLENKKESSQFVVKQLTTKNGCSHAACNKPLRFFQQRRLCIERKGPLYDPFCATGDLSFQSGPSADIFGGQRSGLRWCEGRGGFYFRHLQESSINGPDLIYHF
ncbi:hypothetical protein ABW19_dt0202481 [Dactylella cylindrospora]|nr:hypothetical protein ABW19_dt0202481 [Dactylella cylindrospora]